MSNVIATNKAREIFRAYLFRKGKGAYSPKEYKILIQTHLKTLKKYLKNYNEMVNACYGFKLKNKYPSIRDIVNIFNKNRDKMIDDFMRYLEGKTNFSYDIYYIPEPSKIKETEDEFVSRIYGRNKNAGMLNKLGEFTILIMSEYIILHNYMWSSGLKPKGIKTIDKFLRSFS